MYVESRASTVVQRNFVVVGGDRRSALRAFILPRFLYRFDEEASAMDSAPVPTQMFNEREVARSSAGYLFTAIPP